MTAQKKKHLIDELKRRGHYEQARAVESTHEDSLDFSSGIYAGILASELMSSFDSTSFDTSSSFSSSDSFSGDGGAFGGGGVGGDF